MRNVSNEQFHLPRSFRAYRATFPALSPAVLRRHVPPARLRLHVLPSVQGGEVGGESDSLPAILHCLIPVVAQVSKCIAQLRLLDHGLIDAAEAVEDVVSSAPGKKLKLDLVDDNDEEGEIAGTGDPNAVAKALDKYVKHQLRRASGSRRDDYHDSVVYNTRKAVIKAFLYLKNTRCKYCSACVAGLPWETPRVADESRNSGKHTRSERKPTPSSSSTTSLKKPKTPIPFWALSDQTSSPVQLPSTTKVSETRTETTR